MSKIMDLDEKWFWELIATIDWASENNDERVEPIVAALTKAGKPSLNRYWQQLSKSVRMLDTPEHWKGSGSICSDDMFLYQRLVVIANGKQFFDRVINNPSSFPKDLDFEPLLYVVDFAWERLTGEELVDPSVLDYSINIESFTSPAWADRKL